MSRITHITDPAGRPAIDVSNTPDAVFGARSPVWWGNTLLILIESTTMVLLIASYFYIRQNFDEWPHPSHLISRRSTIRCPICRSRRSKRC